MHISSIINDNDGNCLPNLKRKGGKNGERDHGFVLSENEKKRPSMFNSFMQINRNIVSNLFCKH